MSVILVNAEAGKIPLPDGSVHCSVSSPPYWSLRVYQGDQARHWPEVSYRPMPGLPPLTVEAMTCALGHEPTPEAFVGHLVACYREVWRCLRSDGTCWIIIGDSFARPPGKGQKFKGGTYVGSDKNGARLGIKNADIPNGLKEGDLVGIPAMLFKALQADGWIVRNDNVWHKVNPMPESIQGTRYERHRIKIAPGRPPARQDHLPADGQRESGLRGNAWSDVQNQPNAEWRDCPGCPTCEQHGGYVLRRGSWRHTRAHETVLMLVKQMGYFSDQEAVREANTDPNRTNFTPGKARQSDVFREVHGDTHRGFWSGKWDNFSNSGRNPRSVLTPRPSSYAGQHYATFPPDLIRPLIRSSTPRQCCPECGSGWAPQIEKGEPQARPDNPNPVLPYDASSGHTNGMGATTLHKTVSTNILAYRPTCACGVDASQPGIVLDPFFGSGTTALEAREWGVHCIGLDLSYDYLHDQARERLGFVALDEWERGKDGRGEPLETLPLFEGIT